MTIPPSTYTLPPPPFKCPHCGKFLPEGANFCPNCRKKVRKVCNCWVKKMPYDCGMDECPGYDLWIIEKRKIMKEGKSMDYKGFELISADELTDLETLKSKVLYSDTIGELSFTRQKDIYNYCKLNSMHKACLENLKQIRYAVTRIYFSNKKQTDNYYPYIGKICQSCEAESEKKPKIIDENDIHEFKFALFEFVKRASQKGATAEEVEALPAVAKVLMDLLGLD